MPHWKQSQPGITYKDRNVHVNRRMTEYESRRFKYKADRLLSVLDEPMRDSYTVHRWVAYGNHSRIGAVMSNDRDPLGNGILVGNFENFSVEAIDPIDTEKVLIRFNYNGEIDV